MVQAIAPHTLDAGEGSSSERFRVSFDIVISDPQALWHAAASMAFQQAGMTIEDIEDVLGPAEDPSIADCVAMLTAPDAIPGCAPLSFAVEPIANPKLVQLRERALRSLAMRRFVAISGGVSTTKQ